MIFVTLGTHAQPMDRLVVELDELIARGEIDEPVYVQAASFGVRPRLARALAVLKYAEFTRLISDARVVITHGGPGSIMSVLGHGKVPIVVPRDPMHGEHVDDHQIRFCQWLADRRPIRVVIDVRELGRLLAEAPPFDSTARELGPSAEVIERLREIVEASARR